METMLFVNPTDKPVNLHPIGLGVVGPGATVNVPLELAAPSKGSNGARVRSPIESVAPQMRPADENEAKTWAEMIPADLPPRSLAVTVEGRAPGVPAGVAALRAAKAEAEAEKKAGPVKQSTKPIVKAE